MFSTRKYLAFIILYVLILESYKIKKLSWLERYEKKIQTKSYNYVNII